MLCVSVDCSFACRHRQWQMHSLCKVYPGNRVDAMGCFPDVLKMAETNQPVPILIAEPEGEEFVPGEERDGRHGLKQRHRLVAPLQILIGNRGCPKTIGEFSAACRMNCLAALRRPPCPSSTRCKSQHTSEASPNIIGFPGFEK